MKYTVLASPPLPPLPTFSAHRPSIWIGSPSGSTSWPSDLPVVGQIFGRTHKEVTETDIILTLTPHIVRVLDLHEADLAPFRLERAGSLPTGLDVPGNVPIMPVPVQPAQPDQLQPPASRPILPILPPEPTPAQPTPPTPQ